MFKIGDGASWMGGQFYKPVQKIKDDGKAYATKFNVVFPGNFSSRDLTAAAEEVAAWDGETEGRYVKMADWAKASATNRPGDMAAEYAAETGMSYSDALVACNMD